MAIEQRLIYAGDLWSDIMMLPHNGDMISSEEVEQAIKDAHTVDAVEVAHGRWVDGLCSMCGYPIPTDSKYDCVDEDDCVFCYHCGAKMDGGAEDGK